MNEIMIDATPSARVLCNISTNTVTIWVDNEIFCIMNNATVESTQRLIETII